MAIVHDGLGNTSERISGMGKKLGVSNDGDLQDFFDSSQKNQLWYFNNFKYYPSTGTGKFMLGEWMKYKPQYQPDVAVGPLTEAQRKAYNWGFINIPQFANTERMAHYWGEGHYQTNYKPSNFTTLLTPEDCWEYYDPKDWPSSTPRRASDFEGAWNNARNPVQGLVTTEYDSQYGVYQLPVIGNTLTVTYGAYPWDGNVMQAMANYNLQYADFLGAGSSSDVTFPNTFYFGVMFTRMRNNSLQMYYCTQPKPVFRATYADWWQPQIVIDDNVSALQDGASLTNPWHVFPFLSGDDFSDHLYNDTRSAFLVPISAPSDVSFWGTGDYTVVFTGIEDSGSIDTRYKNIKFRRSGVNPSFTDHDVPIQYTIKLYFRTVPFYYFTQGFIHVSAGGNFNGDFFYPIVLDYADNWTTLTQIEYSEQSEIGTASTIYNVPQVNP